MYNTAYIYVDCANVFHTLRRRVVRRAYTIFLRTRSKKMRDLSVFVIQCYKFLCVTLLGKTRNFSIWKSDDTGKFTWWKKPSCYTHTRRITSLIYRITSSSSRFSWSKLLMNLKERKISLIQGIETHVSSSE